MPPWFDFALNIAYVVISIFMLWKGADWLVDSAAKIAKTFGVSDLVIGLTIVAFGTSAPEFAVSIDGVIGGKGDIVIGNIIGSNVFNLGFILGGCAALVGFKTTRVIVYRDGVCLIGATVTVWWMLRDGVFTKLEGAVMFAALIAYLVFLFVRRENPNDEEEEEEEKGAEVGADKKDWVMLFLGLGLVLYGGHLMVDGASFIAAKFGLSKMTIGMTVVAAGTSAPEAVTSMMAIYKGRHGLSIGNLIGSDLFNLLGVLGLTGMLGPITLTTDVNSSTLVLIGMVCLVVVFMRTGWAVSRWEGLTLLLINAVRWYFEFSQQPGP